MRLGWRHHFPQPGRHSLQLLFVHAVLKAMEPLMVDLLAAEFCQPTQCNPMAATNIEQASAAYHHDCAQTISLNTQNQTATYFSKVAVDHSGRTMGSASP